MTLYLLVTSSRLISELIKELKLKKHIRKICNTFKYYHNNIMRCNTKSIGLHLQLGDEAWQGKDKGTTIKDVLCSDSVAKISSIVTLTIGTSEDTSSIMVFSARSKNVEQEKRTADKY